VTRLRPRRVVAAVVAVLSLTATAACSTHPGDAAVVGSDRLSTSDVDDVAGALCAAQATSAQAGQSQALPTRAARQAALRLLIDARLSEAYGKSLGVEPDQEQIDAAIASQEQTINAVKVEERTVLRDTIDDVVRGQLTLIEVGRRELVERGAPANQVTGDAALQAGTKLRNDWAAKNVDVSVDPRFGTYSQGSLQGSSGSLSIPASSRSKAGAAQQPSSSWVSALPASQKCS
jgi:hypothetical protein